MSETAQPGAGPNMPEGHPTPVGAPPAPVAPPSHEVHIGPVTWVPELRVREGGDRWAHRKGEPRPMALLWASYLMLSTLVTVLLVRGTGGPGTTGLVYACRALLVLLLVGVCILWPMTRLSQAYPDRPFRALLADFIVVLFPAQAIIWPAALLTRWPCEVVSGIALLVACWALLVAGLLAGAYSGSGSHASRAAWMIGAILLASAAPAVVLLSNVVGMPAPPARLLLLSPMTAIYLLTDAPSGLTPQMAPVEWLAAGTPAVLALLLASLAALARRSAGTGGNRPESPSARSEPGPGAPLPP